jgi:hypothetical protein
MPGGVRVVLLEEIRVDIRARLVPRIALSVRRFVGLLLELTFVARRAGPLGHGPEEATEVPMASSGRQNLWWTDAPSRGATNMSSTMAASVR